MALWLRYVPHRRSRYLYYIAIAATVFFLASLYYSGLPDGLPKKLGSREKEFGEPPAADEAIKPVETEPDESTDEETLDKGGEIDDPESKKDGFDPFVRYRSLPKKDWHNWAAMERDTARKGPGEQGTPVVLPSDPETKKKQDAIYRVNGFDGLASDLIAFNRSVKDIRHPSCQKKTYVSKLPSVTVVVPFHNEHWSTLLRTVHSVYERSPRGVLKQIILVDDFSSKEFLKQQLDDYLRKIFKKDFVKVVRAEKREGLIRAREIGAKHVRSSIIVFLDSHSEANYNWLPPLVEPIALDYRTAVCPFVDVVDCDSFEYRAQDEGARGSFDWEFSYKRLPLLAGDKLDPTEPFKSPVMAGGYFAISTKWFWELGGYDEGLDIWGGEQYELSFKIWQCHGRMLDAPCSRVGHIYRCKHVPFPNPGVGDFVSRNYKRVAEVWMDEFKHVLYKRRPGTRDADGGDMSKQLEVRQRLQCKNFKWFMEEVMFDQEKYYPAVEPPDAAYGEIRNEAAQKCIDTQFKGKDERFGLRKCVSDEPSTGGEQKMRYSWWKDVRASKRSVCFDVSTSVEHAPIVLFPCHGMQGNQEWKYKFPSHQLHHPVSNLCLDCDAERGELFMSKCNDHSKTQRWDWTTLNRTIVDAWK